MTGTKLARSLAALAAASLVLTACGGDEEPPEVAAPPTGQQSPTDDAAAKGDGTLTIGTLLPQTGSLEFLGPPEFAGVDLAVQQINEAGGVLGNEVEKFDGDSGDTTTNIASQTVDRLLRNNVDVIIGAASSGVSLTVIDKITGAGVVQISPANTSDEFTTYDDNGLYFRTAPPDVLQGRVLGNLIAGDGNNTLGILALQDAYGTGLADNTDEAFTGAGGEVVEKIVYNPQAAEFSAEVGKVAAADPEAIAIIGFEETTKIVNELVRQNLGDKDWYFVDGNLANYGDEFRPGTLEGSKGTLPGAEAPGDFQDQLLEVDPDLKDFSYAAESYDAVMLAALAAEAAGSDSGEAIAAELVNVSKDGTKCTEFAECQQLVADGEDIDYDGKSGPIEFSDVGDPTVATIGIFQYGPKNTYENIDYQEGRI